MNPTEHDEQVTFCEWLDLIGLTYFHVPNSTWTTSIKQKMRNKALGVQSGIPDLFVLIPKVGLVAIEMKRVRGGVVSQNQKWWIQEFNNLPGIEAHVAKGAGEAMKIIEQYLPQQTQYRF